MNNLLFEMIAARASATGNPAVAELLARMRSGSNGPNGQGVEEMLAQLGQGDPTTSLIAKYIADQKAIAPSRDPAPLVERQPENEMTRTDPPSDADPASSQKSSDAMRELRHQVESMFAELQGLRERIDQLAWALGACCLCWGTDPLCRNCRGHGRPGFSIPDEELFVELVLPAVRTLRAQGAKNGRSSLKFQAKATDPGLRPDEAANQNERKTICQ
jgi:hypothetical protein